MRPREIGENDVIAITFPAHTTIVFQEVELIFFGALKKLSDSHGLDR
jgi:hypothetical protein